MHRNAPLRALLPALAALVVAPLAFAGDKEANDILKKAYEHWNDAQPTEALRLANEALAANPEKVVKTQVQLFIGSLHQVKTGDLDAALKIYDDIIQANVGATDNNLKQLKADAMVRKANILYSEKDDKEQALRLMSSAHQLWPLSTTAEIASQFFFRQGRMHDKGAADKQKALEGALKLAEESITLAPSQFQGEKLKDRLAKHTAKCKLQLAICQLGMEKKTEAEATFASINQADMNEAHLYQWATYLAIKGDADGATEKLTRFMATRPAGPDGAKARNQLRKFIRTEPDFQALQKRPDWKTLTEDEPEGEKAPGK